MPASPRPVDTLRHLLALWPDDPAGLEAACSAVTDWPAVLEEACRHGVLGVLAAPFANGPSVIPADARKVIEQRRLAERLWSDRLGLALGEILAALGDTAIQSAVLKGPVLSERLYDDPSVRISTDLDVLVRPADLDRAVDALRRQGYQAPGGVTERYYRRHHHHVGLESAQGPRVELHFRAFTGLGVEVRSEELIERSIHYQSPNGLSCMVLSPEDELLFLAVHAAGHGWARFGWLYDLKTWLRKYPAVHWPAVNRRAQRCQVKKALSFTLAVLRDWLGTCIPPEAQTTHRLAQPTGRFLALSAECPEHSRRGKLLALLLQASLCDRPGLALSYLGHHFGRIARRRLRRWLPALVPEPWSG